MWLSFQTNTQKTNLTHKVPETPYICPAKKKKKKAENSTATKEKNE